MLLPEKVSTAEEFVDQFVTPSRCEQGLQEVCKERGDLKKLGDFIKWMVADIKKESKVELQTSGLQWSEVEEPIKLKCRKWFMENIRKHVDSKP